MQTKEEVLIMEMWNLFSNQNWEVAKQLFHPEFVADWPLSRERFIGAENFVDMQREYPGNHKIEVVEIIASGTRVATAVFVKADTGQMAYANSYFDIRDGKIWKLVEFWGEPYEPTLDRKKFVVRY